VAAEIDKNDWPLVGRDEELDLLRRVRGRHPATSVVIGGPSGVGKSRLAAEAAIEAAAEGWSVVSMHASPGLSEIPFGTLRTTLQIRGVRTLPDLAVEVEQALITLRSDRGLFVVVNDGQHLDEATIGLLHQMASVQTICFVITARTGPLPEALAVLWHDGLAERIELQELSRVESMRLLEAVLQGPVQDSSASRVWQLTGGNPLYVREVVLSGLETGSLVSVNGEWKWKNTRDFGPRLNELVASRIGRLDDDLARALQVVALASPLPVDLVISLTSPRAVEELESRGLLSVERRRRGMEVSVSQPLHAEVLRSTLSPLRQRDLWRDLVATLERGGISDEADRVRLACWSKAAGLAVDPSVLGLGSDAALFGIGGAISRQIAEMYPALESLIPTGRDAVVRQDHALALRLAEEAFSISGTVSDGVALADAYSWTGDHIRAFAVLDMIEVASWEDRARVADARARSLFWSRWDIEAAREVLEDALSDADAVAGYESAQLLEQLAGFALNVAQPADAYQFALRSADCEGVELSASGAAPVAAASLMYEGRLDECMELIGSAVPKSLEQGRSLSVAMLLFARSGALSRLGRLREARELVEWLRGVALTNELNDAVGIFGVMLGEIMLSQGLPISAQRMFSDAAALLGEKDLFGYRPWALYGLSRSHAVTGDVVRAAALLDEAINVQPIARMFDIYRYLAEFEVHYQLGQTEEALDAARRGSAWARAGAMPIDEALALEAQVRVAPSPELTQRLVELAAETGSELVEALALHSGALLEDRPFDLLHASGLFEQMQFWWRATECATAAARLFLKTDQLPDCRQATLTARRCATYTEGAERDIDRELEGPVTLTRREREVAAGAAAGETSQEIAERLFVSRRTIESHLHHIYTKLGVTNRVALAEALHSLKTK